MQPNILVRMLLTLACVFDFRNVHRAHEIEYRTHHLMPDGSWDENGLPLWQIRVRPLTDEEAKHRELIAQSMMYQ